MPAPAPLRDNCAICFLVMRHLLAAAAAVLMAGPAMAVDYVKCDSIQKAYGRIKLQQREAKDNAYAATLNRLCPYPEANINPSLYGAAVVAHYECKNISANFNEARAAMWAAESTYKAKLDKITADYSAADCP